MAWEELVSVPAPLAACLARLQLHSLMAGVVAVGPMRSGCREAWRLGLLPVA